LIFVCKNREGKWLEVVTNDSTNQTMWIENNKFIRFVSWNRVAKKITRGNTCVILTPKIEIRKRPTENSKTIENEKNHYSFEIIKVKKNWMKISNDNNEYFDVEYDEVPIKGWIKFKDSEKLLLDFEIK